MDELREYYRPYKTNETDEQGINDNYLGFNIKFFQTLYMYAVALGTKGMRIKMRLQDINSRGVESNTIPLQKLRTSLGLYNSNYEEVITYMKLEKNIINESKYSADMLYVQYLLKNSLCYIQNINSQGEKEHYIGTLSKTLVKKYGDIETKIIVENKKARVSYETNKLTIYKIDKIDLQSTDIELHLYPRMKTLKLKQNITIIPIFLIRIYLMNFLETIYNDSVLLTYIGKKNAYKVVSTAKVMQFQKVDYNTGEVVLLNKTNKCLRKIAVHDISGYKSYADLEYLKTTKTDGLAMLKEYIKLNQYDIGLLQDIYTLCRLLDLKQKVDIPLQSMVKPLLNKWLTDATQIKKLDKQYAMDIKLLFLQYPNVFKS